jgi:hypothetical protein
MTVLSTYKQVCIRAFQEQRSRSYIPLIGKDGAYRKLFMNYKMILFLRLKYWYFSMLNMATMSSVVNALKRVINLKARFRCSHNYRLRTRCILGIDNEGVLHARTYVYFERPQMGTFFRSCGRYQII